MRGLITAVSLVAFVGAAQAAPKKKKKTDKTAKKKAKDQEAPPPTAGAEIEMEVEPAPGAAAPATAPAPEASAAATRTPETPPAVGVPPPIADRPLTAAKGKIEVHGGFPITVLSLPDAMGGSSSTTVEGFAFGGSYGVDDKLEIGGDYALSLHPGSIKGPLALHGAYAVIRDAKLEVAVAGALVIDPIESTDPASATTTTTTYVALAAGAWARYRITPMVSVWSGLPALPNGNVTIPRLAFALAPEPYQLTLGFNNSGPIALDLPVGVGIQATPQIYAYAGLTLAHIKLANTPNAFLFADFIPITLGGFYSLDKLDVGASFGTDGNRTDGAGLYAFTLQARYQL